MVMLSCACGEAGTVRTVTLAMRTDEQALALVDDALLDAGHHLLGVVAQK